MVLMISTHGEGLRQNTGEFTDFNNSQRINRGAKKKLFLMNMAGEKNEKCDFKRQVFSFFLIIFFLKINFPQFSAKPRKKNLRTAQPFTYNFRGK